MPRALVDIRYFDSLNTLEGRTQTTQGNETMKSSISSITLGVAILILFLGSGCQTVTTTHMQDIGVPRYPPSDPAQIQILRTEPTRPHVRLGEVRAEPSSQSVDVTQIEEALRNETAKLGADAVVVVYDRTQVRGAVVTGPWWGPSIQPIEGRIVIAVAIKYQ